MTFEDWKKELKRQLLFYGISRGQILSDDELQRAFNAKCSIDEAFNISSDVYCGVEFKRAFYANTRSR